MRTELHLANIALIELNSKVNKLLDAADLPAQTERAVCQALSDLCDIFTRLSVEELTNGTCGAVPD